MLPKSNMPPIAIVLYTYDRMENADPTLRGVLDNFEYDGPLQVHIADDGTSPEYRDTLKEIAGGYPRVTSITVSNAERGGYGKSYNLACQATHECNYAILALEDDQLLTKKLDGNKLVKTLLGQGYEDRPDHAGLIQCIRMRDMGFTGEIFGRMLETPAGKMLLLDPKSTEHHIFAGHARLETVEFQRFLGPWPEGLRPGETEWEVCKRPMSRHGVAWPLDFGPATSGIFLHNEVKSYNQLQPGRK